MAAVSFRTSAELFDLTNVRVQFAQDGIQAEDVVVELWSNNPVPPNPEPAATISTFTGPSAVSGGGPVSFSLPSPGFLALNPNTTYWVVVTGRDVELATTSSPLETGLAGWQIGNETLTKTGASPWSPPIASPLKIEVIGNVIPEPSSILLGLFSIFGFVLRKRRPS